MGAPAGDCITDLDRYLFDLQGFLHLPGVLSPADVAELNALADEHVTPVDGKPMTGMVPILEWGEPYQALLDHPRVLPYLKEWVDPAMRVDSAYGIHTVAATPQLDLHLGGTPYAPIASYHHRDGRSFTALTVVSWALTDVPAGEHGFVCVPGSHKSNLRCPESIASLTVNPGCVKQIPVEAGDAIIFTEALTHGSYPWTLPFPRRVLFYRYIPGFMAFDVPAWTDELLEQLTPRRRQLLLPPYLRRTYDEPDEPGGKPPPRRPIPD
jgi:hypothetical protein